MMHLRPNLACEVKVGARWALEHAALQRGDAQSLGTALWAAARWHAAPDVAEGLAAAFWRGDARPWPALAQARLERKA